MEIPILLTKLHFPIQHQNQVQRPRLLTQLKQALEHSQKLVLVSAPAGYGKTTLVLNWLHSSALPVAWFSLDNSDNDLPQFLTYLIAAFEQFFPEIKNYTQQSLQTNDPRIILSAIINQIDQHSKKIVFVLEDYHVIHQQAIHEMINFLIDNLPENALVVIITRADLPLQIARFRGHGWMTEIRMNDLRFSLEEAEQFLNHIQGLKLSTHQIVKLMDRTEGWAVGLQMAAIGISHTADPADFIEHFTGSDRYIMDYLLEEVLSQQTPVIQNFLLNTSILSRFNASLCDALLGKDRKLSHETIIHRLEKENLFIIPLDHQRIWYRYHQLFANLLELRLRQQNHGKLTQLHIKAADWFFEQGLSDEGFYHIVASNDPSAIEKKIRQYVDIIIFRFQSPMVLLDWLSGKSEEYLRQHPWFAIAYAGICTNTADFADILKYTELAEQGDAELPDPLLYCYTDFLKAYSLMHASRYDESAHYAELTLQNAPEGLIQLRAYGHIISGNALLHQGKLKKSGEQYQQAYELSNSYGYAEIALTSLLNISENILACGHLDLALQKMSQSLLMAESLEQQFKYPFIDKAVVLSRLANAHMERGELAESLQFSEKSVQHTNRCGIQNYTNIYVSRAYALLLNGDIHAANNILQELLLHIDPAKNNLRPRQINILGLDLFIGFHQNSMVDLKRKINTYESHFAVLTDYTNLNSTFIYLTAQLYAGQYEQVNSRLIILRQQVKEFGHLLLWVRITLLQALCYSLQGENERALPMLDAALQQAVPRNLQLPFFELGDKVSPLLYHAAQKGLYPEFCNLILRHFEHQKKTIPEGMVEPLSEREIDVLVLLNEGLSYQEIALKLQVSLNTVKTHSKNIYQKLGVNNRTQASNKAKLVGILSE